MAQIMAWCLTAPSHYLNQCWREIIGIHASAILLKALPYIIIQNYKFLKKNYAPGNSELRGTERGRSDLCALWEDHRDSKAVMVKWRNNMHYKPEMCTLTSMMADKALSNCWHALLPESTTPLCESLRGGGGGGAHHIWYKRLQWI